MYDPGRAGGSAPPLEDADPDWPLRELRAMADRVHFSEVAERVAKKHAGLSAAARPAFTDAKARLYASAIEARNWGAADALYAEEIRRLDPGGFEMIAGAERWARAISALLAESLGRSGALWRYMSAEELASFAGGTFESRVEADGGRRGYKAFSMRPSYYFEKRPALVRVPIDEGVRRAVRPAVYTAMPRPISSAQERRSA